MNVKNCPKCGKLFNSVLGTICDNCKKSEEDIFERVRSFIKDNPGSNIYKIAQETEVSEKKILKYVREGRIELSNEVGIGIQCKKCGANIASGNYCKECIDIMNKNILNKFEEDKSRKESSKGTRMFTDKRDR